MSMVTHPWSFWAEMGRLRTHGHMLVLSMVTCGDDSMAMHGNLDHTEISKFSVVALEKSHDVHCLLCVVGIYAHMNMLKRLIFMYVLR